MKEILVIKKSGSKQKFHPDKIIIAAHKSADRVLVDLSKEQDQLIVDYVLEQIDRMQLEEVSILTMHSIVENALELVDERVAKSYREYRDNKNDFANILDKVNNESNRIMYLGDKENANADSSLVSTKRSLTQNALSKELYKKFFLNNNEIEACKDGYIYIHDMSARRDSMNCCLFDIQNVLKGGFEMSNVWYNEPKTLDTAFDVIGDITLMAASQQYGGFTIPEIDRILVSYAEKSYEKYRKDVEDMIKDKYRFQLQYIMEHHNYKLPEDEKEIKLLKEESEINIEKEIDTYAMKKVTKEMMQGFQGLEYKFNTVASSRGDYPFISITFGLSESPFGKLAAKAALDTRMGGQGKEGHKKPVLFPKLIFLYDENLHGEGGPLHDTYLEGVKCSSKTMYPDWLSLTGKGYIADMYKKYGRVISPMGCVDGKEVITYRFQGKLYVEAFERMWNRLKFIFKEQHQYIESSPNLYMDLDGVEIYDTKEGFVNTKRIIKNISTHWCQVTFKNGRTLTCTNNHPFHIIDKGRVFTKDLKIRDKTYMNPNHYSNESIEIEEDLAWMQGVLLCNCNFHNSEIIISNIKKSMKDKLKNALEKYLEVKVEVVEKDDNTIDMKLDSISNHDLHKKLAHLYDGSQKNSKHIPNKVFSYQKTSKIAFLTGMIQANGYFDIESKKSGQAFSNKEIALQQVALAQTLSMPARIHIGRKNFYVVFKATEQFEKSVKDIFKIERVQGFSFVHLTDIITDETTITEIIDIRYNQDIRFSYDVTTNSDHFEVSGLYSHNCRAFLSPYWEKGGLKKQDESDKPVYVGRFNIGAISLNLPMILAKSRAEKKDFYEVLDYYLEMIRKIHLRTYDYLGKMKASCNPLGFCEGGFLGGNLDYRDNIAPILDSATASFGITALNELQELYNGKSLVEDGEFAIEVMQHINDKTNQYKEEDGRLYAIYGTPAENLCGLQAKQFKKKYGIVKNVSDRDYVSNSFHCHVSEEITPTQKQDLEYRFWEMLNGGKIQYCRYNCNYNLKAFDNLIQRAMKMGLYEGVNLSLAYCDDCGHEELDMDECPVCGSKNLTKIDRMNGYLAYSRVKGDSRLSDHKMKEIADRKSM